MNLSTQQLIMIGWKLVFALIAAIPIITTVAVWLLARFSKAFDAYSGEWAKVDVQFRNLDRLVVQTEKITATTEQIKSDISNDVWGKQQRWLKRLEIYVDLIEKLEGVRQASIRVKDGVVLKSLVCTVDGIDKLDEQQANLKAWDQSVFSWMHTRSVAMLVCAESAVRVLDEFRTPDWAKPMDLAMLEFMELVKTLSDKIVITARKDLGYEAFHS